MKKPYWIVLGITGTIGTLLGYRAILAFLNLPSLLITIGGTLGVTCFVYSWQTVKDSWTAVRMVLGAKLHSPQKQLAAITHLADLNRHGGLRALENPEAQLSDPLLRRGVSLLVDMRREEEVRAHVEQEFFLFTNQYKTARQVLLTMGKLLPAFGMAGTLIGLVLLLHQANAFDPQTAAPAFSVAILTTLYGVVLANAFVLPLAIKVQSFIKNRDVSMHLILEGMALLARNETPKITQRHLTTLLVAEAREDDGIALQPVPGPLAHESK